MNPAVTAAAAGTFPSMVWVIVMFVVFVVTFTFGLALCKAARNGDRQMEYAAREARTRPTCAEPSAHDRDGEPAMVRTLPTP